MTATPTVVLPTGRALARDGRTRRGTELALLVFALLVVLIFSAAVEVGLIERITGDVWVQVAIVFGIFGCVHIAVRRLAPFADPALLPIVALINGIGVAFLRRLDLGRLDPQSRADYSVFAGWAFRQIQWTAAAALGAVLLLILIRDHQSLSRYAYTLGLFGGLVLVLVPALLPGRYSEINGAKLWILIGGFSIQPGEFAKLALLSFFAYYLMRKKEVLSLAGRRILGIDFPRGRDLGPVLVVWMLSLGVLIFQKDLGTSLLYFGMFMFMLYIATERSSWLIVGLVLFLGGAIAAWWLGRNWGGPFYAFSQRVAIWWNPFDPSVGGQRVDGGQMVQSLLGLGTGGIFGAGPGRGLPYLPGNDRYVVPEVQTDFIFAGIGEEIGLFGLAALLMAYLLIVVRGLRAALTVRDAFGKLLAGGLAFTLGLQVFVIIGGVTGLVPLTGQTTPYLSAGGSSLMANWLLLAILLRISDAARRPPSAMAGGTILPPLARAAAAPPPGSLVPADPVPTPGPAVSAAGPDESAGGSPDEAGHADPPPPGDGTGPRDAPPSEVVS